MSVLGPTVALTSQRMTKSVPPPDYHLYLLDIAMAAAAQAHGVDLSWIQPPEEYTPGCIRSSWLARSDNQELRQRVTALATASSASLSRMPGQPLHMLATRFRVPLTVELAETIAE